MRNLTQVRAAALLTALALFASACQPAQQPVPTAASTAKPTSGSPAAASSPAPAAKPAASPAPAKPGASPAASPAAAGSPAAGGQLSGTLKIVSSFPRTGSSKGQTDTIVNAIKMALEEVNYKVGGATIVFEDMDDATPARGTWDAGQEAQNATKAANDADVVAYIGTFNSGAAKISIPILCPANLLMISPANTYPGLTKKVEGVEPNEPDVYYPGGCKRNYTRVVPSDELQGAAAANWAKTLGATKAYVLDDSELYGKGLSTFFKQTADKVSLSVVGGPESIDPKASDYRALAQKIRSTGADMVYFGGITQSNAGKLWQDLRAVLGNNVKLMGPDGMYEAAFPDAAGQAAEGTYITFGGVPPSKLTGKGAQWYQAYKTKFNAEPEAYAAYGYEAAKVVLDGLQRAGRKDRGAIRDAVFATRNYDGVLGNWSFTDTGDTTLAVMSGRQIKDGKFDDANAVTLQVPR